MRSDPKQHTRVPHCHPTRWARPRPTLPAAHDALPRVVGPGPRVGHAHVTLPPRAHKASSADVRRHCVRTRQGATTIMQLLLRTCAFKFLPAAACIRPGSAEGGRRFRPSAFGLRIVLLLRCCVCRIRYPSSTTPERMFLSCNW